MNFVGFFILYFEWPRLKTKFIIIAWDIFIEACSQSVAFSTYQLWNCSYICDNLYECINIGGKLSEISQLFREMRIAQISKCPSIFRKTYNMHENKQILENLHSTRAGQYFILFPTNNGCRTELTIPQFSGTTFSGMCLDILGEIEVFYRYQLLCCFTDVICVHPWKIGQGDRYGVMIWGSYQINWGRSAKSPRIKTTILSCFSRKHTFYSSTKVKQNKTSCALRWKCGPKICFRKITLINRATVFLQGKLCIPCLIITLSVGKACFTLAT